MVIDVHQHAKLYSILMGACIALGVSFAVVQLFGTFWPDIPSQLVGLVKIMAMFLLWRWIFAFCVSHCLRSIDLRDNGFLLETLTDDRVFVEFSHLTKFRLRTWGHRSLLSWTQEKDGVRKEQFVYFSSLHLDAHVVDQLNLYLQHNIARRISD